MKINIVSVASHFPKWIEQGCDEYTKRMKKEYQLKFIKVNPSRRTGKYDVQHHKQEECKHIAKVVNDKQFIVALDKGGEIWSTQTLADKLQNWSFAGKDVSMLIGGADGLGEECLALADTTWSLSKLTFPHAIAKLVVVEQLYRAICILNNHPYHK